MTLAEVVRFPCACPIEHGGESCAHVDAVQARMFGVQLEKLNSLATLEEDQRCSECNEVQECICSEED